MTVYTAAALDPEYAEYQAMVAAGEALLVGERYDAEGLKHVAIEIPEGGLVPNVERGAIRIGREFFTTALRDYQDWREKWWREAVQNAVDAGASRVIAEIEQQDDGGWRVMCRDDGGGMSEDVLIDKFLVLGGTTKVSGESTGGFGKAKELLVLPWMQWRIHTRDRVVEGTGVDYTINEAERLDGVELTVWMPPDEATTEAACLAFLEKCSLPNIRFEVNGRSALANLRLGDELQEFGGKAKLYYEKTKGFRQKLLVRSNGLFMFDMWISDGVEGTLIVELTGRSIDLLTANRDGFRDYDLKRDMEQFVNRLSADLRSALRKKQGLVREKFRGSGQFKAKDDQRFLRANLLEDIRVLEPLQETKKGAELSTEQIQILARGLERFADEEPSSPSPSYEDRDREVSEQESGPLVFRASAALASTMLDGIVMNGANHVEAAIRQLSWQPDFFVVNEIEGFRVPKRFWPKTMSRPNRTLARFWAELCRFVLIQLGSTQTFGVGWVFDESVGAEFIHEEDENWLMLNPFSEQRAASDPLVVSNRDHVAWLYAAAVHECTHMADGITYHDESFASAMTRNVARTSGKEKQIRSILREVRTTERT